MELMDIDNVGEKWVTHIGMLTLPPGIRNMSHRPFAACVFRLFAHTVIEGIEGGHAHTGGQQMMEEIQYIYGCMNRCSALREIMGDFNYGLAYAQTPSDLVQWAHETLEEYESKESNGDDAE